MAEMKREERSETISPTLGCVIKDIIVVKQLLLRGIRKIREDNLGPQEFYIGQYSEILSV